MKIPTEVCHTLDVNRLLTQGALRPGVRSTQWWTLARDATIQASIETVATVDGLTLCYTVGSMSSNPQNYSYTVPVTWIPCNYGGSRPYFICPGIVNNLSCRRRVTKIYLPPRENLFLCRHCYRLTYYSCKESGNVHFTAMRRTRSAARKLGLADPEDVYIMHRPKGMHKRTFERLRKDVIDAIEREEWAFGIAARNFVCSVR
jgi:hypothetical protein